MTTAVSTFSPDFLSICKGLQSQRVSSDFRQHVSLALERQLSGQLANSFNPLTLKTKAHPPLTASNSVATSNAATHLKALVAAREHRKLDRSVSEPAVQRQPPPNSSRYKTELCRPYEENGTCKYGDKCQFAHGYNELRTLTRHPKYKTEPCRTFHTNGFCPYGPRCHFIHNKSEDSKKCLLNTIQSDYDICGFSIGSAGDLSPTGSISSSGSPTSSLGGFFLDEMRQTAAPMAFYAGDYVQLKPQDEYQASSEDDEVMSSIDLLISDLDLDGEVAVEGAGSKPAASAAVDINRNLIRLPIFSRLALGSSP